MFLGHSYILGSEPYIGSIDWIENTLIQSFFQS